MNRNPVLNSPNDITDELIHQIINNDLDSLTINPSSRKFLCLHIFCRHISLYKSL